MCVMWHICVCMGVYTCVCPWKSEISISCLPLSPFTSFYETECLSDTGSHQFHKNS